MRKVLEDSVARELLNEIDIYWDGNRIDFEKEIEIDPGVYVVVKGSIDYTYNYEPDTNGTYMTWVSVDIEDVTVLEDEDGNAPFVSINESFVEKYLEQYLMDVS